MRVAVFFAPTGALFALLAPTGALFAFLAPTGALFVFFTPTGALFVTRGLAADVLLRALVVAEKIPN